MSLVLLLIALLGQSAAEDAWTVTGDIQRVSDPTIIRAGTRYYIYCSGPGIPARVSTDLQRWDRIAPVFAELPQWAREKVPGATAFWAPDISFRDGRYWLYYAVSTLGSRRSVIGLATNATLDGADPGFQWQDQGLVWETRETDDYNAIDPNAVEGSDGQLYLAFGSFWTGLKMVLLDRATGKAQPGAELMPIASRPGADAIEGACIVPRGAYYYLFCSHDFTGRGLESTYKVVVGRASTVTGPFVDRAGRMMLEGGGTTVVASDDDGAVPGTMRCCKTATRHGSSITRSTRPANRRSHCASILYVGRPTVGPRWTSRRRPWPGGGNTASRARMSHWSTYCRAARSTRPIARRRGRCPATRSRCVGPIRRHPAMCSSIDAPLRPTAAAIRVATSRVRRSEVV